MEQMNEISMFVLMYQMGSMIVLMYAHEFTQKKNGCQPPSLRNTFSRLKLTIDFSKDTLHSSPDTVYTIRYFFLSLVTNFLSLIQFSYVYRPVKVYECGPVSYHNNYL